MTLFCRHFFVHLIPDYCADKAQMDLPWRLRLVELLAKGRQWTDSANAVNGPLSASQGHSDVYTPSPYYLVMSQQKCRVARLRPQVV